MELQKVMFSVLRGLPLVVPEDITELYIQIAQRHVSGNLFFNPVQFIWINLSSLQHDCIEYFEAGCLKQKMGFRIYLFFHFNLCLMNI